MGRNKKDRNKKKRSKFIVFDETREFTEEEREALAAHYANSRGGKTCMVMAETLRKFGVGQDRINEILEEMGMPHD